VRAADDPAYGAHAARAGTRRSGCWRKADARWRICGIPGIFYTDHGGDFTSRHLEQVAADLQVELIFSEAGMPRGKGKIERFFRTVDQLFLARLPVYAPGSTPPPAAGLTLADLDERLRAFLLDDYHRRIHGETGQPPQERWEAAAFLPRLAESLEQLDVLLLTVATGRRVRPDGIRFQGLRYLDLTLAAYVGETVTIRYDPRDLAELRVYHGDLFLCRAVCQEVAGQELSLPDIVRARRARRQALRGELTEHRAIVDAYVAAHQPEPVACTATAAPPIPGARLKRYRDE
jgi:putative transposase